MRIIAGKYRGKNLFSPTSSSVRPTSDRAREAIFNILRSKLGDTFEKHTLLDVFSGSGAFGLEGLSRGFNKVCFIDVDVSITQRNASLFQQEKNRITILKADVKKLPSTTTKYDLVFMDAPYKKGLSEIALGELQQKNWLAENALIVVEVERNEKIDLPQGFEQIDERFYGLAKVLFIKKAS